MTDPSFAGQLITFTYPHIGNYGASAQAMESERAWARAAIMREACNREDAPSAERGWLDWLGDCGVHGITGVDTRALVRHIRDAGAMRGGVFPADAQRGASAMADRTPSRRWPGRTSRAVVTPDEVTRHGAGDGPSIAVIDTGIKASIVRELVAARRARGAAPLHDQRRAAARARPRRGVPRQRPRRPGGARLHRAHGARARRASKPVWGICLGHQLLCRAVGLETFKLPFGHHGANHPVKDLHTGRVEITSQNHGFAVLGPGGERTHRQRRARALGDRLRRRRALARQPVRPHGRGARAARRARRHRPVPPRGRARARTTACTCSTASCERIAAA